MISPSSNAQTLPGLLYDGQSSAGVPVTLKGDGLLLYVERERKTQVYNVHDLDLEPPVAGSARHIALPGGGQIEVENHPLLSRWFAQSGRLERVVNWSEQRWPIAIASVAVTAVFGWAMYTYALPWSAGVIANAMPEKVETVIADNTMSVLGQLGIGPSQLDVDQQAILSEKFYELADLLEEPERYTLYFRSGGYIGPNAFAMPGGNIVITDPLVRLAENDDEVLAVLAHELGHGHHRHAMRNMVQSSLLGIIWAVATGDAGGLAAAPLAVAQATYTRTFEREADDFAIALMQEADISPKAFADLFRRLQEEYGLEDSETTWLDSHPALSDRIAKAEAAAGG